MPIASSIAQPEVAIIEDGTVPPQWVVGSAPSRKHSAANQQVTLLWKRVAKTSAVTIDRPSDGTTLASVMKKVQEDIDLKEMGVNVLNTRKLKTGGILLEIETPESRSLNAVRRRFFSLFQTGRTKKTSRTV